MESRTTAKYQVIQDAGGWRFRFTAMHPAHWDAPRRYIAAKDRRTRWRRHGKARAGGSSTGAADAAGG